MEIINFTIVLILATFIFLISLAIYDRLHKPIKKNNSTTKETTTLYEKHLKELARISEEEFFNKLNISEHLRYNHEYFTGNELFWLITPNRLKMRIEYLFRDKVTNKYFVVYINEYDMWCSKSVANKIILHYVRFMRKEYNIYLKVIDTIRLELEK